MLKKIYLINRMFEEPDNQDQTPPDNDPEKNPAPKTYTEEELNARIDAVVNKKYAEWKAKSKKEADEAAKLAAMTEQERAEHERDELEKQLADYKHRDQIAQMSATARQMLSNAGITAPEAIVTILVNEDADKTKSAVDAYIAAYGSAVSDGIKAKLAGKGPEAGTGTNTVTKEEILAIKDTKARQQAIKEHLELFK